MREDELFEAWRNKYGDKFIPDGIVDEDTFANERIRFVFVLKEVSECYNDFDLRCFLAQGAPGNGGHTWAPVTRWLGATVGITFPSPPNMDTRIQWLKRIGAINLKKTTGTTVAIQSKIAQAAEDDAELLKQQISLYLEKSTLFPCCGKGVFELFRDHVINAGAYINNSTQNGIKYIKFDNNGIAFSFCHPNAKKSRRPELFAETVGQLSRLFAS